MLTFLDFISTIQGCSSIRQGVARRGHSFSRLSIFSKTVMNHEEGYLPALDEVLEVLGPLDASLRLVLQRWDGLPDDVSEKIDKTSTGVHLCAVRGEREAMLCHFEKGHT